MGRKATKPSPKIPSFFKALVGDFSHCLSIPPEFMNYVNGRLPPTCTFRGPSGECWTVGLELRGDRFVFHNGWQGFVKDHSLEIANFLVFDYDGKSKFDVTMYDPIGTEKELEPAKKRRGNQARVEKEIIELETKEPDEESEEDACISNIRKCKSGKRIATDGGKEISNAHVVFRSKHPCFIGAMTKNHYRLNIPKALAVAKGLIRKKSVKVEDPNGISWDVKLRLDGKEHRGGRLFMTKGLSKCFHANNISLGDTLVFELFNAKSDGMKIHIFRGNRNVSLDASNVEYYGCS
ncbi:putative B3 domain-containing protein Os03g0621600 [Prunus avium]|uniref:B3 domain-containing protein Os03g0621600 n=1 Tax=Prunus avium TaxID=42229 RepID=A0A6P5REC9_PRUAV|nr:putative B3 domain-containing protein Os03g0621600 [Prunus avium]